MSIQGINYGQRVSTEAVKEELADACLQLFKATRTDDQNRGFQKALRHPSQYDERASFNANWQGIPGHFYTYRAGAEGFLDECLNKFKKVHF